MQLKKLVIYSAMAMSLGLPNLFGCSQQPQNTQTSNNPVVEGQRAAEAVQLNWGINYGLYSATDALDIKYALLLPHCRNDIERDLMKVIYQGLRWGKQRGLFPNVNIEDLMAEGRQESGGTIDLFAQGKDAASQGSVGTNIWNFHQLPGNDLNGMISMSVWQDIAQFYLLYGRLYSDKLQQLFDEYVIKYDADIYSKIENEIDVEKAMQAVAAAMNKIAGIEGKEKAKVMFDEFIDRLAKIVEEDPTLHIKVLASHFEADFRMYGAPHSPNGIREYFWIAIQKNLVPEMWLNPVRYDDDIPPSEENNFVDNNVQKRGDYAKQVMLGNSYNDRGMVYWYAAARDEIAIREIVEAWASDPAHLTKEDYQMLKDKDFLGYIKDYPEIYNFVMSTLPSKADSEIK